MVWMEPSLYLRVNTYEDGGDCGGASILPLYSQMMESSGMEQDAKRPHPASGGSSDLPTYSLCRYGSFMAGWMVSEGGMGSGTSESSAYEPRVGRLRGGRVGACLSGETSVRLRLRLGGLRCWWSVGSCVGGGGGAVGGTGLTVVAEGE